MIPKRGQMTVCDLLNLKGKRQITMITTTEYWVAKAAQTIGIDILSTWGDTYEILLARIQEVRKAAPNVLLDVALPFHIPLISDEEAMRGAVTAIRAGADIIYPGVPPERVAVLAKQGIPCHCHVGLVPFFSTWIGGLRAFGKNSKEALKVYKDALAYQEAGAVMIEMECVPDRIASEIAKRLDIPVISMGSGSGCDGQFLFSNDILGIQRRMPRHAKKYRDFSGEAAAAFKEFKDEVNSGIFPTRDKLVDIKDNEYELFIKGLDRP